MVRRWSLLVLVGCTPALGEGMFFDDATPPEGTEAFAPPMLTSLVLEDDPATHPRRSRVTHSSNWTVTSATPGYSGSTYRYRDTSPADHDPVSWWFRLPQPMTLDVSGWWTQGTNRSDQAGFYALDAQVGLLGSTSVDQTRNGSRWVHLGTWDFPAGWNRVALSRMAPAGKVVIADAIQLEIPGTADLMTQLEDLTSSCNQLPGTTLFRSDASASPTIPVCELQGAVWWTSDFDIDCDGGTSALCRSDPYYLPGTAAVDSQGNYLDASNLPFVVAPLPSNGFDYQAEGLAMGTVVAILYNGQLEFAVIGDLGPRGVIGEGSAALADRLGINSHPVTGGASGNVATFIAFTGSAADVDPIEDFNLAQQVGDTVARQVIAAN